LLESETLSRLRLWLLLESETLFLSKTAIILIIGLYPIPKSIPKTIRPRISTTESIRTPLNGLIPSALTSKPTAAPSNTPLAKRVQNLGLRPLPSPTGQVIL
jgi:hypothetical protein